MKKSILIITFIILTIATSFFIYTLYLNNNSKNDIKKLKSDIQENQELINDKIKNKEQLEKEYKELNEELKEEVLEYNLWLEMKEKITK